MNKRDLNKKGISPVVASVLLIALVLVLASIVFLWARGFIGEQIEKGGKPAGDLCAEVNFNFNLIETPSTGIYNIEIVNNGNIAIHKFMIIKRLEGNEERFDFDLGVNPQEPASNEADLSLDGKNPESITIYPVLLGTEAGQSNNRPYTCTENGETKTL